MKETGCTSGRLAVWARFGWSPRVSVIVTTSYKPRGTPHLSPALHPEGEPGSVQMFQPALMGKTLSAVPSPGCAASRNPCDTLRGGSTETYVEEVAFELSLEEGRGFGPWVKKQLSCKRFTQEHSVRKTREKKTCISRNTDPSDHR